jgi:hypothetical protein
MHYCAGSYRRLMPAIETFVGIRAAFEWSITPAATTAAHEPVGPTSVEEIARATRLVGKRLPKLGDRLPEGPIQSPLPTFTSADPIWLSGTWDNLFLA